MLKIHIHSGIVNQIKPLGDGVIKLFYYLKALDCAGSGCGELSVSEAAKLFERSQSVVRRWIRDGVRLGIFRAAIKAKKGIYKIYYSSVLNLRKKYGATDLGAISVIGVVELRNIKFKATEADAIRCQKQSYYAATKGKKLQKLRTIKPDKILCSKSKRILLLSSRFVYLASGVLAYGASQENIGNSSGISCSTVQRRLSNKYRDLRGLEPVSKKQQCVCAFGADEKIEYNKRYFEQSQELINSGKYHIPKSLNKLNSKSVFKSHTNIYDIYLESKKQRFLRWKLNKVWDSTDKNINSSNSNRSNKLLLIKRNKLFNQLTVCERRGLKSFLVEKILDKVVTLTRIQ